MMRGKKSFLIKIFWPKRDVKNCGYRTLYPFSKIDTTFIQPAAQLPIFDSRVKQLQYERQVLKSLFYNRKQHSKFMLLRQNFSNRCLARRLAKAFMIFLIGYEDCTWIGFKSNMSIKSAHNALISRQPPNSTGKQN